MQNSYIFFILEFSSFLNDLREKCDPLRNRQRVYCASRRVALLVLRGHRRMHLAKRLV